MMHQSVWGDAHHSLTQEVCLFTCERASEGPGSLWMNLSTDMKTGKSRKTSEPTSGASPHVTSLISACCLVQRWF